MSKAIGFRALARAVGAKLAIGGSGRSGRPPYSTVLMIRLLVVRQMHLSDLASGCGLWAGTAINDTSSVVAAGYSYSMAAGDFATIVKLTRATLIIPVCLTLAIIVAMREKRAARHGGGSSDFSLRRIFPWSILWEAGQAGFRFSKAKTLDSCLRRNDEPKSGFVVP